LINRPAPKPVAKTIAKPTVAAARPASKAVAARPVAATKATPVTATAPHLAPKPVIKKHEAPNANNYSLGGRSPFVTNTKIQKRPLGANVPETSASALRSTHNVYSQKSPTRSTENARKHIVTEAPAKKSGWLWTLIVIAVIAAGGGVGYLFYAIFFAH
jgi:hypothetical protein